MSTISEQINQKFEYGKSTNEHKNVAIDLKIHDVFQVRNLPDDVVVKEVFELDIDSQIIATCCHFTEFLCRVIENHQLS